MEIGPIWDTFDFLSNAMYFAGYGFGYMDMTRPPVVPFLTSLFFRLGFISETPIFILDGIFYVLGVLGLYFFFKLRFSTLESFLGGLLFATFPIVLFFSGVGLTDIPGVSFSIWALYLTVLAVKKNSKFFFLSFLLAVLAFLTRYPSGLIIFPIFIYIFINRRNLNYRDMSFGILISLLPVALTFLFFFYLFNDPFYPFELFYGTTQSSVLPELNYYYFPDFFYFIKNMPAYIGGSGVMTIAFVILGASILGVTRKKKFKEYLNKLRNFIVIENKMAVLLFIILLFFFLSLNSTPYMVSELLFLVLSLVIYYILDDMNFKYLDMDLLFLAWFMAFFIFHSVFIIKDDRYFLTMAPAVSYFLVLGFSKISGEFNLKVNNFNLTSYLFSIILMIIILASAFSYIPGISGHEKLAKDVANDSAAASVWLMNYDLSYKNKTIYADYGPYLSWYLKTNVKNMPVFMDGQMYDYKIKGYNITEKDMIEYNNELIKNNAEYYFSTKSNLNLTNYKVIRQFGNITIYIRIN